jgi:hypothetical protein
LEAGIPFSTIYLLNFLVKEAIFALLILDDLDRMVTVGEI